MTSRTSQATFERALALLDDDQPIRTTPRASREPEGVLDMSANATNLTSPSRRRNRTSPTSPSPASPLRDYLNRHSIQLGDPSSQRSLSSPQRTGDMNHQDDRDQTPRRGERTFGSASQDPFIDERTQATASLYVTPRRPLRSSIFEVSPRRSSEGQPGTSARSRGDRHTSATLRYALEATPARDLRASVRSGRQPGAEQTTSSASLDDSPPTQVQTSFLDVEADPPAELDERFPAIEPATSSPNVPQRIAQGRPSKHKQIQTVDDIWLGPTTQYELPQHSASTPPELASVRGISVEHIQEFVRDRNGAGQSADDQKVETGREHEGHGGWQTGLKPSHGNMPVSRNDLDAAVDSLQSEMRTIRQQLGQMSSKLVASNTLTETRLGINDLPSDALQAILEIDALVHHVALGERDQEEVLARDNLTTITDRIREWEGVVRGRSPVASLAGA